MRVSKNPFGIKSLVIKNMKNDARNQYQDRDSFIRDTEEAIRLLIKGAEEAISIYDKANKCNHNYTIFEESTRRNFLGFYTHYERKCEVCGNIDIFDLHEDEKEAIPDWVQNNQFTSTYYNLNI